jgi:hypothetical protein
MLRDRYDLLVRDRNDKLAAVVEVKNLKDLSPELAATLRGQLKTDEALTNAPYTLLVTQDVGYIWADSSAEVSPHRFPMDAVLARYTNVAGRALTEEELTLRTQRWLIDLSLGSVQANVEPERTLASLGFLDAIRDGTVAGDFGAW